MRSKLPMSCEVMTGQIQQTPQYAAAMTRAALMANNNPALTQILIGRDIPFYYECLSRLEAQKKLKGKFDLEELATVFSSLMGSGYFLVDSTRRVR